MWRTEVSVGTTESDLTIRIDCFGTISAEVIIIIIIISITSI